MDFSLILFSLLVATGVVSLGYRLMVERPRLARAADASAVEKAVAQPGSGAAQAGGAAPSQPMLVEYARALFPVILVVFLLRSFVVEPFRIPSGSMLPSLYIGDFILVDKFSYGIRLPLVNVKIWPLGDPGRGDVMVFRYPRDPKLNFIKRVVGVPGDVITYRDKHLLINGTEVERSEDGRFDISGRGGVRRDVARYQEIIDASDHHILIDRAVRARDMEVTVPPGQYFVMGDNRDHSNDSRYWRFVPEDHVVGRAFFIWFSWKPGGGVEWRRIGDRIH